MYTNAYDDAGFELVSEILPNLFLGPYPLYILGGFNTIRDVDVVVSLLETQPVFPSEYKDKKFVFFKVDDSASREASGLTGDKLLAYATHLKGLVESGQKVYVHCQAGISRSPTLVIATLMLMKGWGFQKALHEVSSKRPVVHPNPYFKKLLQSLEEHLNAGVKR